MKHGLFVIGAARTLYIGGETKPNMVSGSSVIPCSVMYFYVAACRV